MHSAGGSLNNLAYITTTHRPLVLEDFDYITYDQGQRAVRLKGLGRLSRSPTPPKPEPPNTSWTVGLVCGLWNSHGSCCNLPTARHQRSGRNIEHKHKTRLSEQSLWQFVLPRRTHLGCAGPLLIYSLRAIASFMIDSTSHFKRAACLRQLRIRYQRLLRRRLLRCLFGRQRQKGRRALMSLQRCPAYSWPPKHTRVTIASKRA